MLNAAFRMQSVQRGIRRRQGSGIKGWQECASISYFNSVLGSQNSYSTSPCSIAYRVISALVFMRIFSRIRAR